ncbi:MAG: ribosome-associated translation inhibitor RaiA [Desulfobacteraceae bacterium]|nr:MAG: ribosome-associated translation inhibitor RaiA [Desulfobacteraceae bacterium]
MCIHFLFDMQFQLDVIMIQIKGNPILYIYWNRIVYPEHNGKGGLNMEVTVNFKNIKSSDKLKDYIEKKLNRVDKLFDKPTEARVVFSKEKEIRIVDINLIGSKLNIHVKETGKNMRPTIDLAVDKLKSQLKKLREKIYDHRTQRKPREEVVENEIVEE